MVLPQVLYLGEYLDYTLLCPNQLCHNGIIVDDIPCHLAPDPNMGKKVVAQRGGLLFFYLIYYGENVVHSLERVGITYQIRFLRAFLYEKKLVVAQTILCIIGPDACR
jgi:hypothetical protein